MTSFLQEMKTSHSSSSLFAPPELPLQYLMGQGSSKMQLPVSEGSNGKTHYEILSLTPAATDAEVRNRYKLLVLQYHPDKNPNTGAVSHFRAVQEAYETLHDPARRAAYDKKLSNLADRNHRPYGARYSGTEKRADSPWTSTKTDTFDRRKTTKPSDPMRSTPLGRKTFTRPNTYRRTSSTTAQAGAGASNPGSSDFDESRSGYRPARRSHVCEVSDRIGFPDWEELKKKWTPEQCAKFEAQKARALEIAREEELMRERSKSIPPRRWNPTAGVNAESWQQYQKQRDERGEEVGPEETWREWVRRNPYRGGLA